MSAREVLAVGLTTVLGGMVLAGCAGPSTPARVGPARDFAVPGGYTRVFSQLDQRPSPRMTAGTETTRVVVVPVAPSSRYVAVHLSCAGATGSMQILVSRTGAGEIRCTDRGRTGTAFLSVEGKRVAPSGRLRIEVTTPGLARWSGAVDASAHEREGGYHRA